MDRTERIKQGIKDLKQLYGISEAEENCMMQMFTMIKLLGYSPELTIKLLKALTAMMEVIQDEDKK